MNSILILTALCVTSVAIATDRCHIPSQIVKLTRDKYLATKEADNSFGISLKNINIYDEIPKYEATKLLNRRIEKAECYMAEGRAISTTVKKVLGTILANSSIYQDEEDDTFAFIPKGPEFAIDNCATHHVCNDKSLLSER